MAQGYNLQKKAVPAWEFKALAAAGGIRSSVSDMIKYVNIFLSPPTKEFNAAIKLCEKIVFNSAQKKVGLG